MRYGATVGWRRRAAVALHIRWGGDELVVPLVKRSSSTSGMYVFLRKSHCCRDPHVFMESEEIYVLIATAVASASHVRLIILATAHEPTTHQFLILREYPHYSRTRARESAVLLILIYMSPNEKV